MLYTDCRPQSMSHTSVLGTYLRRSPCPLRLSFPPQASQLQPRQAFNQKIRRSQISCTNCRPFQARITSLDQDHFSSQMPVINLHPISVANRVLELQFPRANQHPTRRMAESRKQSIQHIQTQCHTSPHRPRDAVQLVKVVLERMRVVVCRPTCSRLKYGTKVGIHIFRVVFRLVQAIWECLAVIPVIVYTRSLWGFVIRLAPPTKRRRRRGDGLWRLPITWRGREILQFRRRHWRFRQAHGARN